MVRSTRHQGSVNHISVEDLKEVLGPDFENAIRAGVSKYFADLGLFVAEALIAGEVDFLCGPKHKRKQDGDAIRWGSQPGVIQIRGAKETIQKPRVRAADGSGEIDLETYKAFNKKGALSDAAIARIGSGVSTRNYVKTIQTELVKKGVSKSAVSRRVIAATEEHLRLFLARRFENLNFVAILLDGVRIGKTHVVAAVGVDKSGKKHILGWHQGSTENHVVCRDLIRRLVDSGLNLNTDYLFIIDGSKALEQAIKERFGDHCAIQRCQEHKIRDVEGYLPFALRKPFRIKLQAAFNQKSHKAASDRLQKIRLELLNVNEQASRSLSEGLENTLTLHRLGVSGGVRESLRTTNIIESAFSRLRQHTSNVSSWADSAQVDRWLAFGLLKVEKGFRQLPGYRQLASLQRKLQKEQIALQSPKH